MYIYISILFKLHKQNTTTKYTIYIYIYTIFILTLKLLNTKEVTTIYA
jgi:hypothetical protein